MPSESSKKRNNKKNQSKSEPNSSNGKSAVGPSVEDVTAKMINVKLTDVSCAGVLTSHPASRDVHLDQITLTYYGAELLVDAKLELNCGRRYGLIGLNGCGKSTLLRVLAAKELPVPAHFDIYHLAGEIGASDKTAIQCVMEVEEERVRLEKEAEELAHMGEECHDRLMDLYERLDEMDASSAEAKAARILNGLGFTAQMQNKQTRHFSGGWRMRIALARALFVKPDILLLDEPTNHLDLEATVWLEEELKNYRRILVLVSHSQDFLNGVCTNVIHMNQKRLKVFGGNYDTYIKTRAELEEHQMKQYTKQQADIAHMKDYIARFGHGSAKLARQAQSKEKTLGKMVDAGLVERVVADKNVSFYFPDCESLPPPVLQVQNASFQYNTDRWIYRDLDFGLDLDSRVALVGPNGAGKSTLLKMLIGDLVPTKGIIRKHAHLKIGRYHQHLQDLLDMNSSGLKWMQAQFPEEKEEEEMRRFLGRFGLTGKQQTCTIHSLSDGQRSRIIFAWLAYQRPHMLFFDEPTNHLDIETIDALADAVNDFNGGIVLVSHDFRLIKQVAKEIWVCENGTATMWDGDIFSYKAHLRSKLIKD